MLASILTLVVGNPLQINPQQQVVINQNANVNLGYGTIASEQSSACSNAKANDTISTNSSSFNNYVDALTKFKNSFISTFQATFAILLQLPDNFLGKTSNPNINCAASLAGNALTASSTQFLVGVGQTTVPQSVTNNPQLDQAIGIAVVFIALGLLAGLFGAGLYAGVISVVGIMLSLVYYSLAVLNLPNPSTGTPYLTLPAPLMLFFLPIVAVMLIWIILNSLHSA